MGSKTSYLENQMLATAFGRRVNWTPPNNWTVLLSTDPFDAGNTSVSEPNGGGYSRFTVANTNDEWTNPAGGNPATIYNVNAWVFPAASGDWGTILSVYLADDSNHLCYGTDIAGGGGVPITTGSSFTVPAGGFLVRET